MTEKEFLESLDKYQLRYLSQFMCAICHKQFNKPGCFNHLSPRICTEDEKVNRAKNCLKYYKPRLNRRKNWNPGK